MKDSAFFIRHILEAIQKVETYTADIEFTAFETDEKTVDAVVRELTVIGEAATSIDETFRNEHPEIPWHEPIGMRNRIVHEYWSIDSKVVWDTCIHDLPQLKQALEKL